jgi:threonine/homoserine/homoserine lactone efflux protein
MDMSFLSLVVFWFVLSIAPGPNNILLLASSLRFRFRRSLPHVLGAAAGAPLILVGAVSGIAAAFEAFPWLSVLFKVACCGYALFLAWRIATAGPLSSDLTLHRPLTFWEAAAFQLVNPAVWAAGLAATGLYLGSASLAEILVAATVLFLVDLPAIGLWAVVGGGVGTIAGRGWQMRTINVGLASLLVLSLYPVLAS